MAAGVLPIRFCIGTEASDHAHRRMDLAGLSRTTWKTRDRTTVWTDYSRSGPQAPVEPRQRARAVVRTLSWFDVRPIPGPPEHSCWPDHCANPRFLSAVPTAGRDTQAERGRHCSDHSLHGLLLAA